VREAVSPPPKSLEFAITISPHGILHHCPQCNCSRHTTVTSVVSPGDPPPFLLPYLNVPTVVFPPTLACLPLSLPLRLVFYGCFRVLRVLPAGSTALLISFPMDSYVQTLVSWASTFIFYRAFPRAPPKFHLFFHAAPTNSRCKKEGEALSP